MIADHANRGGSAVANISIGWDAAWGRISAVEDKVQEAINAGITIVASAGNKNQDAGCCTLSDMTSVIVVGASDINDARAVFDSQQSSNYGSTVNVFAPGLNVTVASNGSDTDAILDSGTSMSAPIIAGLVARYLQATPGASPAAAQSAIASNATYTPSIGATPNLLAFSGWLDTGGGGPGRWKLDGNGGCYWDPNDSGPDQCSPTPGRWKLDANGNCYWDPNDSGPNQCNGTTTPSADRVRETFAHIFGLRPKISRIRSAPLDASHQ